MLRPSTSIMHPVPDVLPCLDDTCRANGVNAVVAYLCRRSTRNGCDIYFASRFAIWHAAPVVILAWMCMHYLHNHKKPGLQKTLHVSALL